MTEIFDQAAALNATKTHAFAIADDVRDMEAATNIAKPVTISAPRFDDNAFRAQMDNANKEEWEAREKARRKREVDKARLKRVTARGQDES